MNPMKTTLYILLLTAVLVSCSGYPDYTAIPLSQFTVRNELLPNQQLVQILRFSGAPDYNNKTEYYVHMIVVNKATGDTFNMLSIAPAGIQEDADKEMHFFAQNTPMYQNALSSLQQSGGVEPGKPIETVLVHNQYRSSVPNRFPTVIGILGTYTPGNTTQP